MAKLIPVRGRPRWVHPTRPPYFTLRELQELVRSGGPESFIEVVTDFHYGSVRMLVSEDGRLNDLPVNDSASILALREVRGHALLLTEDEFDDLEMLWAICYTPAVNLGGPEILQSGFDFGPDE
jgi:hypothetical protein